jgi:hypothetical protein
MIPVTAQQKLAALVQAAGDAQALAFAAKDRAEVIGTKIVQLHNARASDAEIARTAALHEAAQDLQQQRYRLWQDAEQLLTRVKAWVNELPRGTLLEAVPAPAVAMNGNPSVVVGELRSNIAALISQYHLVKLASAPLEDARQQVRDLVAKMAKAGTPRLTTQFGKLVVHGWDSQQQFGPVVHSRLVEFLAWYDPDRMIAALDREVDAQPHDDAALPLAERASKLAEIEGEIAILEQREEFVITQAAKDGIVIARRHDQSPASILGVQIVRSAARAA